MFPQLGTGSPTPRPKNDNVTSARMYCGTSSAACVSAIPSTCGKHVPPQEVDVRGAEAPCRDDIVPQPGAEHDTANQSRRARPPDESNHREDQQKRLRRLDVQRQRHPNRKQEIQPRQREEQLRDAHDRLIHPRSVKTGQPAEHHADAQREAGAQQPGEQRDLSAVKKAGELIPPVVVTAQQKEAGGAVGSEQMPVPAEDSGNPVRGASNEEAHRIDAAPIFRVFLGAPGARQPVHERAQVQPAGRVDEMEAGRRSEREIRDSAWRGRPEREIRRRRSTGTRGRAGQAPVYRSAHGLRRTTKRARRSLPGGLAWPIMPALAECADPPGRAGRQPAGCRQSARPWSTSPRQPPDGDRAQQPPRAEADRVRASS